MYSVNITYAKYLNDISGELIAIRADIGERTCVVPLDPANSDYAEIMRQVEAGELTIQPADGE